MKKSKIIILMSLRCLLFIFSFLSLSFIFNRSLSDLGKWWSIICSVCNVITLFILFWIIRVEKTSYIEMINYQKKQSNIKIILIGILVVVGLGISGMFIAGYIIYGVFPYLAKELIAPIPFWFAFANVLILPISTTLAEDGLYLGMGVNRLSNKWLSLLIPAIFYALQHSFIPLYFDANYMIYRFFSFLPLTILLCYWYQKKRNPTPIMIGHLIINMATAIQILIMSTYPEIYNAMLVVV